MRKGHAGTLESNDIFITIEERERGYGIQIELTSAVEAQYGNAIKHTLTDGAIKAGLTDLWIKAVDKGALDCTIQARLATAIDRAIHPITEGNK
jgi:citrate lyase subunit gamma (acyl carrier protein)